MNSSEECEVIAEGKLTYQSTYGWQHWQVPVITDDGLRLDLRVLTENGLHDQKEYSVDGQVFQIPDGFIVSAIKIHQASAWFIKLFELYTYCWSSRRALYLKEFLLVTEAEMTIIRLRKKVVHLLFVGKY